MRWVDFVNSTPKTQGAVFNSLHDGISDKRFKLDARSAVRKRHTWRKRRIILRRTKISLEWDQKIPGIDPSITNDKISQGASGMVFHISEHCLRPPGTKYFGSRKNAILGSAIASVRETKSGEGAGLTKSMGWPFQSHH